MPGHLRVGSGQLAPAADENLLCAFEFMPANPAQPLGLRLLDGDNRENWYVEGPVVAEQTGDLGLRDGQDYAWLCLRRAVDETTDWAGLAESLFDELHQIALSLDKPHVIRLWTMIPDIHHGQGDAERYKQFCLGRHHSYARRGLGAEQFPAATVIGGAGRTLELQAIAGRAPGRALENPQQTSAYHYPREFGPRSPSFSRAMELSDLTLVSGTAAVRGSASQHAGDVLAQLGEIFTNLRALAAHSVRPTRWPQGMAYGRLYLRHAQDCARVRAEASRLLPSSAHWPILEADICRQDLLCEIETAYS